MTKYLIVQSSPDWPGMPVETWQFSTLREARTTLAHWRRMGIGDGAAVVVLKYGQVI